MSRGAVRAWITATGVGFLVLFIGVLLEDHTLVWIGGGFVLVMGLELVALVIRELGKTDRGERTP